MRLVVIFGPPAVGKMTVGRALAARSGFRLFHNHAVLEPLLEVFDYGTPPFIRLLGQWRRGVIEEAAAAGVDLVVTYVWGLELEDDARELSDYIRPYVEQAQRCPSSSSTQTSIRGWNAIGRNIGSPRSGRNATSCGRTAMYVSWSNTS